MELVKKIEATRQLGGEFLTWLMARSNMQEGIFQTEMGSVELWFEERLTLVSPFAGGEVAILKGEAPAEGLEAALALRKGKLIEEARLSVTFDGRKWELTFNGPRFALTGIKVPAVLSETEFEAVMERFDLLSTLEEVFGVLYHEFLSLRLEEGGWGRECQRIEKWLRG